MQLETERLMLVPLTYEQLEMWLNKLPALERELDCVYKAEPVEGIFRQIVEGQRKPTADDPDGYFWHSFWFIIRKSDRIVVGAADFKDSPDETGTVEIGYGLAKEFEHNGYMTEAVDSMCRFAARQDGVCRIIAETDTDGTASQRVLARCGFTEYKRGDTVWFKREMQLETERLILREWRDSDAGSLYEYAKDPRVGPIAGWPPHTSVENSLGIIHTILSEPETYAVVLKETGEAVGSAGIMLPGHGSAPMSETEAEIGYWIGVPYWGRGLIPEAVCALLRRSFTELSHTGVWCGYYDGNEKSKRVQEKCGFVYHHTNENAPSPMGDIRTEHFTYMTREQWERLSKA